MLRSIMLCLSLLLVFPPNKVGADDAPSLPKFYLSANGTSVEKRVDEHAKKITDLEAKVKDLQEQVWRVEQDAINAKASVKSKLTAVCELCGCGCVETGQCRCKNCNEHTADPNWRSNGVTKPVVNPNFVPATASGSVMYVGGVKHTLRADGVFWPDTPTTTPASFYPPDTFRGTPTTTSSSSCPGGVCPVPSSTELNIFGKPKRR